jgi:aerobic-type carbon monoxide dehydrogenase small subunit (CoxS/CutS family)
LDKTPDSGEAMANKVKIKVNGRVHRVAASPNTPLLYVLRNELRLNGPRFGCGLAQCGSCSVLHNGKEIRSCITPVAAVGTGTVTTLEGLAGLWKGRTTTKTTTDLHPVQQAWIDEQVPQCGYCQNGMMIKATELLNKVKRPTEDQIKSHMNTHLCRCGTYPRITKAIKRAAVTMAKGA